MSASCYLDFPCLRSESSSFSHGVPFSNGVELWRRLFAVHTRWPQLPPWMVEPGMRSRTIESLGAIYGTTLPKRRKCRVRPARTEGITVVDQDDQNARESRSRLDLAGGRLFRPNWR